MECHRKRARRGKSHGYLKMPIHSCFSQHKQSARQPTFTSKLGSFLIMTSLIGIIYLMLDYHCRSNGEKCKTSNLTKNIEQIGKNLSTVKSNYQDLEMQIEMLEMLVNTCPSAKCGGWDPKTHLPLPNVDVFLKKPIPIGT